MSMAGEGAVPQPCAWTPSIDQLYRETDRLYYTIARGCGISECAYWVMYAIEEAGGSSTMREVGERWAYSKQTVNSAVKTLEKKGLVELAFVEGSRKAKRLLFTEAGRELARRSIVPAMAAERRAFASLDAAERAELLRLIEKYTRAIDAEIGYVLRAGGVDPPEATVSSEPAPSAEASTACVCLETS